MNPVIVLLFCVLFLAAVNAGFALIEWCLARKANRTYGLAMPFFFFIIAIMSMVTSIEKLFTMLLTSDTPLVVVFVLVMMFLFLNIPTLVTYAVYFRVRRKMGERPWPLKKQTPPDSNS